MHVRIPKIITTVAILLVLSAVSVAEDLPRRAYPGVELGPTEEQRGVEVTRVMPQSAANYAGIETGDVIQKIGPVQLLGPGAVQHAVQSLAAQTPGKAVLLTVTKGTYTSHTVVELPELPRETSEDFDTVYTSVEVNGDRHRALLTLPPESGPHPAVFYLQGLSCSSVESPLNDKDPVRQLIAGWTHAGYATFRIEKRGVGDSEGAPCSELDFNEELQGYEAGLRHLKNLQQIDGDNVFLFGHSMGGAFAPLVAQSEPVAGLMVYGTIAKPIGEYFVEHAERMNGIRDAGERDLARSKQQIKTFLDLFLGERLAPEAVLERDPSLAGFLRARGGDETHLYERHYLFWHQLDDRAFPEPWRNIDVPVLAIWGASDATANRSDHLLIESTVNAVHPGRAAFLEIPDIGHRFDTATSPKLSAANNQRARFNPAIVEVTLEWLGHR